LGPFVRETSFCCQKLPPGYFFSPFFVLFGLILSFFRLQNSSPRRFNPLMADFNLFWLSLRPPCFFFLKVALIFPSLSRYLPLPQPVTFLKFDAPFSRLSPPTPYTRPFVANVSGFPCPIPPSVFLYTPPWTPSPVSSSRPFPGTLRVCFSKIIGRSTSLFSLLELFDSLFSCDRRLECAGGFPKRSRRKGLMTCVRRILCSHVWGLTHFSVFGYSSTICLGDFFPRPNMSLFAGDNSFPNFFLSAHADFRFAIVQCMIFNLFLCQVSIRSSTPRPILETPVLHLHTYTCEVVNLPGLPRLHDCSFPFHDAHFQPLWLHPTARAMFLFMSSAALFAQKRLRAHPFMRRPPPLLPHVLPIPSSSPDTLTPPFLTRLFLPHHPPQRRTPPPLFLASLRSGNKPW